MTVMLTPFQTVGPFGSLGLRDCLSSPDPPPRDVVMIRGRLFDGRGQGIPDGVLELWHPSWADLVRVLTEDDGSYAVQVPRAAGYEYPDGTRHAPHIAVRVIGRGILTQYLTRIYFSDAAPTDADPIFALVPRERRETLIATRDEDGGYHFDVILQGDRETVFFDV
jgi:protocatechuate 3,4-dioxygenase, alpha subunit